MDQEKYHGWKKMHHGGGGVYFMGFVGALIFYIQSATTFAEGAVGFLKALAWPAFLVYEAFNRLGM